MTTHASNGTTDGGQRVRLIRRLVVINLGLVALQALSAGFLMSGYARALTVHAMVAAALQVGALIQVGTAVVLWRRHRVPTWITGVSIGLFVIVLLQVGLGYRRSYWLHVPIGVGMFGGLMRQVTRLDTASRAGEERGQVAPLEGGLGKVPVVRRAQRGGYPQDQRYRAAAER